MNLFDELFWLIMFIALLALIIGEINEYLDPPK